MQGTLSGLCIVRYTNNAECYIRLIASQVVVEAYASNRVARR